MFTIGRYVHFLKTRDFDAAMRHLGQLLSRFPASPPAREAAIDLVRLRMMRGQRDLAMAALEAMIAGQPAEAQRYVDAAQAVRQHGLPLERAVDWLTHAATLRGDAVPLFLLGQVHEQRSDVPAAIAAYRKALERAPNDGASKQALGRLEGAAPPKTKAPGSGTVL
jgi:tetratricopeptide (TPR) repeat protein